MPKRFCVDSGSHPSLTEATVAENYLFSLCCANLDSAAVRPQHIESAERSSRPLKFWLLGNFLSAGFRKSVHSGALAAAVGARVAMVTYGWPSHLRCTHAPPPVESPGGPAASHSALRCLPCLTHFC